IPIFGYLEVWHLQSHVADSSAPAPFEPPSSGSTSHVVEASDTPKPGEVAPIVDTNVTNTNNTLTRPVPPRLWQNYGTSYGGYGSSMYNSSYGSGMYGSYGGLGGSYSDVRCCEFLLSNFYTNRSEYSGLSLVHGRSSPD
ncbi:peroxisomal membrane protein 13-like, partial [Zingiber officinale]|uniref:peroxisomal membrane protein 13-like n=1 Tax=Zingiber officinale TaxID=94328 RepID=UPI001C4D3BB6